MLDAHFAIILAQIEFITLLDNCFYTTFLSYHGGADWPEEVKEVHAGEWHGEQAEDHIRHGQVEDEDVPGVGLDIVSHR